MEGKKFQHIFVSKPVVRKEEKENGRYFQLITLKKELFHASRTWDKNLVSIDAEEV